MEKKIPPYFFDPKDIAGLGEPEADDDHDPDEDTVFEIVEETVFHIGQSYGGEPAETIKCKFCGSTQFNVGVGHFYTGIRCPNCEWEFNIHQG